MSRAFARIRVAATLRRTRMPRGEICAVLAAHDPEIVRRYLELHRERLEEQLDERRRVLATLARSLTELAGSRATV
jgi:hypothetical protein